MIGRWALAALVLLAACAKNDSGALLIRNVSVVDVRRGVTESGRSVLIRGRIIEAIGSADSITAPGARRIDGDSLFLMPGLWDMHVHVDENELPVLVAWGVTGVRDMGGALAPRRAWQERIAAGTLTGPRLVMTGPMLVGPGADPDEDQWIITTAAEGVRAVDSLAALRVPFIKVHERLTRSVLMAILREARRKGIVVAGHVPDGADPVALSRAGLGVIEHLEFIPPHCMVMFRPAREGEPDRAPTPLECGPDHIDSLIIALTRNGTWLDPTISSFRIWVTPTFYRAIYDGFRDVTPSLRRGGALLLAGTDLGDSRIEAGTSLHDELTLLVEAGFTPAEALRAATINPSRILALSDSLGTVEVGRIADLVLLEADPLLDIRYARRIYAVIREGRLVDREELDRLIRRQSDPQ